MMTRDQRYSRFFFWANKRCSIHRRPRWTSNNRNRTIESDCIYDVSATVSLNKMINDTQIQIYVISVKNFNKQNSLLCIFTVYLPQGASHSITCLWKCLQFVYAMADGIIYDVQTLEWLWPSCRRRIYWVEYLQHYIISNYPLCFATSLSFSHPSYFTLSFALTFFILALFFALPYDLPLAQTHADMFSKCAPYRSHSLNRNPFVDTPLSQHIHT